MASESRCPSGLGGRLRIGGRLVRVQARTLLLEEAEQNLTLASSRCVKVHSAGKLSKGEVRNAHIVTGKGDMATAPRGDLHTSTHLHSVKVRTGCEGWECEWYRMRRSAPKGRSRVSRYDPAKCLNSPKPRVKLPF